MTRGRKPPKHEPLICAGCHRKPRVVDGAIPERCVCGAAWNLHLLNERTRPAWLSTLPR